LDSQNNTSPSHGRIAARIGKNTAFGVVANLVQLATRLVTIPFVISHLGLGGYGIWNIIMLSANYMRFGSVGVKTAFQKYVAEATGDGDYERAKRLLSTGCALMLVLSIVGLIPAALFAHQIVDLAGVPAEFHNSAAGAVALLALIMAMSNVGAVFESILMGAQRLDLVRSAGSILSVVEAISILIVISFGWGLFAMAGVMGASELVYVAYCYFASRRVVPEIRVSSQSLDKDVLYELFRFAGSYQLVNILEIIYGSLLPFAILKAFGPSSSGVYAIVCRLLSAASILQDAFLPPLLSEGSRVFATGYTESMRALLIKSFKATMALSLLPFGFTAAFGTTIVYAWTGQANPAFPTVFWLSCLTFVFRSLSMLSLVLYRVSGRALLDNIRQVVRILVILLVAFYAQWLGFYGVLGGMAAAEGLGMFFMLFALTRTFENFRARALLPDALRVIFAAALILGAGAVVSCALPFTGSEDRTTAILRLSEISLACLLVAWPVVLWTGSLTATDAGALLGVFFSRRPATPRGNLEQK
jgi:O-antigen/teichoic acid export membrane protein